MKSVFLAGAALAASSFAALAMPALPAGATPGVGIVQAQYGGTTVIRRDGRGEETTIIRRGERRFDDRRRWREETGSVDRCRTVVIRKMDGRGNEVVRRIRRCG